MSRSIDRMKGTVLTFDFVMEERIKPESEYACN